MIYSSKLKAISTITLRCSVEKVANLSIIYLFICVLVFISPTVRAFIIISKFLRALCCLALLVGCIWYISISSMISGRGVLRLPRAHERFHTHQLLYCVRTVCADSFGKTSCHFRFKRWFQSPTKGLNNIFWGSNGCSNHAEPHSSPSRSGLF